MILKSGKLENNYAALLFLINTSLQGTQQSDKHNRYA